MSVSLLFVLTGSYVPFGTPLVEPLAANTVAVFVSHALETLLATVTGTENDAVAFIANAVLRSHTSDVLPPVLPVQVHPVGGVIAPVSVSPVGSVSVILIGDPPDA